MKLTKVIFKDSFAYGFIRYLSLIAAIMLTPIYTRTLSKESYGLMELFNSWNTMALAILPLGMTTAILKYYPDFKDNRTHLKKVLGTIFFSLLLIGFFYFIVSFLIADLYLKHYIGEDSHLIRIVYWQSVLIVSITLLNEYSLNVLRSEFKKGRFVIVSLVNFAILTILGYYFVYWQRSDFEGFYRASLIAIIIATVPALFFVREKISFVFNWKLIKMVLKFSIHFVSVFLLFHISNLIDRYLINEFIDLESVGNYSIANRIASMSNIIFSSFVMAWYPFAMSIQKSAHLYRIYASVHKTFVLVSLFIITSVWLFKGELLYVFAPTYYEAMVLIVVLLASSVIMSASHVYTLGLHYTNNTAYLSRGAILSVTVHVIASLIFVNEWGVYGIAIGALLGSIVWTVVLTYYSQKMFYIPHKKKYFVIFFSGLFVLMLCDLFWKPRIKFEWNLIIFKIGLLILIGLLIFRVVYRQLKNTPEVNV